MTKSTEENAPLPEPKQDEAAQDEQPAIVEITEVPQEATPVEKAVVLEAPKEKLETPIPAPIYRTELDRNLPMDERISAFLESRATGDYIKMNDYLKSLYPLPKMNELPAWIYQPASKQLRVLLEKMVAEGRINIRNNTHLKLGHHHYPDATTMKVEYRNLNNVLIEGKK
jgi:hypothetical protein